MAGPVPASPADRVSAVKADLLHRGIGGAFAQGHPFVAEPGFAAVVAAVAHYLPDAGERRALCRQMADDLQSMIIVGAVEVDEIEDVLGVTPGRFREHGVSRPARALGRSLTEDALALAREVRAGEGERLERWARDDHFVLETLAVLFVAFTRLAV